MTDIVVFKQERLVYSYDKKFPEQAALFTMMSQSPSFLSFLKFGRTYSEVFSILF